MNDDSWFSPMDILRLSVGTWLSLGMHAGIGVVALLMTIRLPSCAPPPVALAEPRIEKLETIDLDLKPIAELDAPATASDIGSRAKGDEGKMGGEQAGEGRYGIKGPSEARAKSISAELDKMNVGILGALKGSDSSVSSVFKDGALGNDPMSARGNMWGDSIGESFGAGGLGSRGIGEGGGGRGEGIGLGSIGTIGHGARAGTGQGYGSGSGRLGGSQVGKGIAGASVKGSKKDGAGAAVKSGRSGGGAAGVEGGVAGGVEGGVPGGVVGGVPGGVVGGVVGGSGELRVGSGKGAGLAGISEAKEEVKEKEGPSGDVRVGGVQVTGSLASDNVSRALRARNSRLRQCYETALAQNKSLSGRVQASLDIDADGRVTSVTEVPRSRTGDEGTTLGDPAAVRCVLAALRGLSKLKPVEGSASAVVSITFSPR
jgi:hypothetical protein